MVGGGTAKIKKSRRICAFCGGGPQFTKEHAWPRWLHPYAKTVPPTRFSRSLGFARISPDTWAESPTVVVEQPGSVLRVVAREVCARCNGGWMSRLEQDAKPILLRLMQAAGDGSRVLLGPAEAATVGAWAVKTAWVRELASKGSHVATTSAMRRFLAEQGLPSEFSSVWLARYLGVRDFEAPTATVGVQHQDHPWDHPGLRYVLKTCLVFNGLAILALTVDGWGVPVFSPPEDQWALAWPATGTVTFPPPSGLSDEDVMSVVGMQTPWLRMPLVERFDRSPGGPVYIKRN